MLYQFKKFEDGTLVMHSQQDDVKKFIVHFERVAEDGFDSARCEMPGCEWIFKEGYSEKEIEFFEDFLEDKKQALFELVEKVTLREKILKAERERLEGAKKMSVSETRFELEERIKKHGKKQK